MPLTLRVTLSSSSSFGKYLTCSYTFPSTAKNYVITTADMQWHRATNVQLQLNETTIVCMNISVSY